jgi:hypothetical protein
LSLVTNGLRGGALFLQTKRFCKEGLAGESVEPIQLFALVSKATKTSKVRKISSAMKRFFRFS